MSKRLFLLFFFYILSYRCESQILPKEGSVLYYRLIGFSFPKDKNVSTCKIEIASGSYSAEDAFRKNIIQSADIKDNRTIAEVPYWGSQYTWRIVSTDNDPAISGALHHFSTANIPDADTNNMRLRVVTPAQKYENAYVFLDANKALYDMNGHIVWYLPDISLINESSRVSDLKPSPFGTITFMVNEQAYEINYSGDILWKAPNNGIVNGDTSEHYHHEFTRLSNGHYMVLGNENFLWKPASSKSAGPKNVSGYDKAKQDSINATYPRIPFGTLIEYDEKGNVIWSWRSVDYFKGSDAYYISSPTELPRFANAHANAFFFDENSHTIYISFKAISRIIKLKYPEGIVTNFYGEVFKPGVPEMGNGLFCGQHSCRISQKGYLYLFNNNSCDTAPCCSKITMMKEPISHKEHLKKIWEYTYDVADNYPNKIGTGGNVIELPDQSIFCAMNKIFIVSPDKSLLWSAFPEKWNKTENKWELNPQYRGSIILNRQELEHLIWNEAPVTSGSGNK